MRLTVDTRVVVKRFVDEPLSDESRLLLAHRLHLWVPAILLSEFANTIWQKVLDARSTIRPRVFDELEAIPATVELRPAEVIDHAARVAVEIDHPVYNCLYLACAEAATSGLIAADHLLADNASDVSSVDTRYVRSWTSLGISRRLRMLWSSTGIGYRN